MIGEAVVNGFSIPVTGISLRNGQMILQCTVTGPVAAFGGGAVTIFGEDGSGICQGYCDSLRWRAVGSGEVLDVWINMQMDRCFGDAEEVR